MNAPPLSTQLAIGSYQGTCTITNGKKPVVSRVTLRVTRQDNQTIHGWITTTGSLKVDQEFAATMTGDQLLFVTANPKKKLTITWLAGVQGDTMQGTYSATRGGLVASFLGKKDQHGDWHCRKERFPFVRRLKSFAKGSLVVAVVIGFMGGIIALSNVGSSPSSPGSAYTPSYESTSQSYEDNVSSPGGYKSRLTSEDLRDVTKGVYGAVIDSKRVDVRGYNREGSYVRPHDRQPPGGITLGDKAEAGAWALGAVALVQGVDYLDQKFDPAKIAARKQAEEQQRAESQRRFREQVERREQQKPKPWWRR